MKYFLIKTLLIFLILSLNVFPQQKNLILEILKSEKEYFDTLINNSKYDIKIIYTRIDRDKNNQPVFTTFKLNAEPEKYFYPASTVKLPACVFALEKINELKIEKLDKSTYLKIYSSFENQDTVEYDSSTTNKFPTIENYIKKILLVSDNDAFNRLYEFLGQKELNQKLWAHGFKNSKISHRLSVGFSEYENRFTNKFRFYNKDGIIYEKPAEYSNLIFDFKLSNIQRGIGYYSGNKLINQPKDFSQSNYFSLQDQHDFIKTLFFGADDNHKDFNLTYSDYKFLFEYMAMLPRESQEPVFPEKNFWDSYVKFFMFGDNKNKMPEYIRIFNKVGEAYGFLTDNAYIVDFENKIEFLLSAVIHVNKDEIFNDDKYEYDEIGFPFLAKLGRLFYQYELKRNKKYLPDLSKFEELFR